MKYTEKKGGRLCFTPEAKVEYELTDRLHKDAVVMDLFGCLGFACGKSRWDGVILWTHMDSRRIVIAVKCPSSSVGWVGCPYPTPTQHFSFVHEQGYEIRIYSDQSPKKSIKVKEIKRGSHNLHWLNLPEEIRKAWAGSL